MKLQGGGPSNQNILQVIKWTKPATRHFECNIDASFASQYNKLGIDICIRDELGAFVLARYDQFTPVCSVHIGEAHGLLSVSYFGS
ncbi:cytochrome p450 [Trifolium pratense]|uniref:Cytochrome p450 n=1 Tax=Trifolium pratense TaxID=57577 RepID=A0A2K3LD73_TRIPR|nr:cytochrome p450 [Trifolium pratense]